MCISPVLRFHEVCSYLKAKNGSWGKARDNPADLERKARKPCNIYKGKYYSAGNNIRSETTATAWGEHTETQVHVPGRLCSSFSPFDVHNKLLKEYAGRY